MTIDVWTVDYRPGGWARVRNAAVTVYLRLRSDGGSRPRLRIHMATVSTAEPLTAAVLRSVPLAEVDMHLALFSGVTDAETDRAMAELSRPVEIEGYSPEALERYFSETEPLAVRGVIPGTTTVNGTPLRERFHLGKPPGGRLTDEFLRNLAGIYLATVEAREAPAPVLAKAAGVSVRTVHGWVAEARRRGILPPATKGRAGVAGSESATFQRPDPQPVIAAIVTSDRGVLVGRRQDGTPPWTFIAGWSEPGESPADTLIREVKEEADLRVRVGERLGDRVHPDTGRHMIYYAAHPTHGTEVYVGDEAELAEVRWVSLAEADELLPGMFGPVREYLARTIGDGPR